MTRASEEKGPQDALSIVEEVLDLPKAERVGALLRACGDDAQLLEEALGLAWASLEASAVETPAFVPLAQARNASPRTELTASVGSADASEAGAPEHSADAEDRRIGPFRVVRELGHGGMGTVYLAEQREPIRRRVAIKVAQESLDERARVRLAAERQAMARLSHENIAQLYEAGATDDGHPYFAMEVVDGDRLTEHCDRLELGIDERLRLFLDVCAGVEHAHRHGIIHRDLKPSNILVAKGAEGPRPKVIDFGIAKATDGRLHEKTLLTGQGLVGTPAYLSPESISEPDSVDTRTDVYSLGVILQELLIGVRLVPEIEGESAISLLHRIHKETPPPILRRWRDLDPDDRRRALAARGLDGGELEAKLRGDLEWIVGRATARSKDDRYDTVAQFAADVRRHLDHQPVLAGPPSGVYQFRKLVRRHRVTFAFSVVLLLSLVGGFVARTLEADRARRLAADAIQAREETEEVVDYLTDLFKSASPRESLGDDPTASQLLERGVERLQSEAFDDRPAIRARLLQATAQVYWRLGRVDRSRVLAEEALEIRRRVAPDSTELAETLTFVGVLAGEADDHEQAEELLRQALAVQEVITGRESAEAADILVDLAAALQESDQAEEALPFAQRALAITERIHGPRDRRVLAILNNLAILASATGRKDEAEESYRRIIDGLREILPSNHPSLALTLYNLGNLLADTRRAEEALPLLEEARAIEEEVLGPDHPDFALTLNSLGTVLRTVGQWDAAQDAFEKSLAILEKTWGPDHAQVGMAVYNLAQLAEARGDFETARAQHDRAFRIRGAGSVNARVGSLLRMAKVERLRGDPAAASRLLGTAAELLVDEEASHSGRMFLAAERGWLALEAGDNDAAEDLFRRVLDHENQNERAAEAQGEAWKGLARLALARGEAAEAGEFAHRSLEMFEPVFAPEHAFVEETRALIQEIDRRI